MPQKSLTSLLLWDRLGIGISAICTVHCLLFPAFIAVLPLWPASQHVYEWTHPLFILLLIPTVWYAVRRSHYNRRVTTLLASGFILVFAGWIPGHLWLGYWAEISLTLTGSIILIVGHLHNYRHHQVCKNSRHNHHPVVGAGEVGHRSHKEQEN